RGLVTIQPRVGTVVNDYRREGSLALLTSLMRHADAALRPDLLEGLLSMRALMEVETARLAARHRTDADLRDLDEVIASEAKADPYDLDTVVGLDFELHHRVALASANPLYSMLLKSCEPAQRNLARLFFEVPGTVPIVFGFHAGLVEAIRERDGAAAAEVMRRLLHHGRDVLNDALNLRVR
ncbi:MAG: FadR family transcriptional regulator, partial [Deltaproteobacteria bacterium]|nr:FadR family transcriptional regulator [Deltaproteobacteria bacterium]